MDKNFINKIHETGLTYQQYFQLYEETIARNEKTGLQELLLQNETIKLNLQRTQRISKTYNISDNLKTILDEIKEPQLWMILSEVWCGDSAQTIPYFNKIAESNNLVTLKILLRDENSDIMDKYLTDGKYRSIPKLVAFDKNGNELFQWGPRPAEAIELVKQAKENGKPKEHFLNELHLWFARNKGRSLEKELIDLLKGINSYN